MSVQTRVEPEYTTTRVSMPVPTRLLLQRKCGCSRSTDFEGECEACRQKRKALQRCTTTQTEPTTVPSVVHDVLRSNGQPLDQATLAFMESRFGHDFSRVRVHSDAKASEGASVVRARAYTVGTDIAFAAGEYAPRTSAGLRLLAHELAHVVQQENQSSGSAFTTEVSQPSDPSEIEAELVADAVTPSSTGASHSPGQPSYAKPPHVRVAERSSLGRLARAIDLEHAVTDLVLGRKKPKDLERAKAAEIGEAALREAGYEKILRLAEEIGFLKRRSGVGGLGMHRSGVGPARTLHRQAAEAVTFGAVFGEWAVAAGITSQLDSPAPGPADVVAIGILVVGLAVAGVTVLMSRPRERPRERTRTRAEPITAQPTPPPPDVCRTAIKLLTQYERIAQKMGSKLSPNRIAQLNALRDAGTITMSHLPGSLQHEFPGELANLTLAGIRALCGG